MSWHPRFTAGPATLSDTDDVRDDADGRFWRIEWFGVIAELHLLRRGAHHRNFWRWP